MTGLSKLLEPGRIGRMGVRNRMVMAPMATFSADKEGYITQRTIDHYVERAKGGVGLIISQATRMSHESRFPTSPSLYDDKYVPRMKELSRAVHDNGARMALQLGHSGVVLSYFGLGLDPEERKRLDVLGPSPIPWVKTGATPKEAAKEDIRRVVRQFGEAARRVKDAGFDAVEIHGAHGYLISAFLSPLANRRTDEYGGGLENRARFACEILAEVRKKVGLDFPIIFRLSGSDYLEGGITLEDSMRQAPLFVEAGADALHVSASAQESTQWQFIPYLLPDAALAHLAEAIKKVVSVPIIAVGKMGDPLVAERILQEGKADFVAMGRPLLADPELPNKAKEGRLEDIRRCIYCNNCMHNLWRQRLAQLACTVNPALLRGREFMPKPTSSPKRVMVVGGGLAGMEAARVLAERGHHVSLYERSEQLGGQWNIACRQPSKKAFGSLTEQLSRGLERAGVRIMIGREVTRELVGELKPDAVVVATGATPKSLEVPGVDGKNVVQAVDVIMGTADVGERVVVVGGRYVGMEVADYLARQGKKVSLVTRRQFGRDIDRNNFLALRDSLLENGVHVFTDSLVREIRDNGVYFDKDRELWFLRADTVVLAVGATSENRLVEELKGIVAEIHTIGDCVEPRSALHAIREGAEVGRQV